MGDARYVELGEAADVKVEASPSPRPGLGPARTLAFMAVWRPGELHMTKWGRKFWRRMARDLQGG